MTNSPPDGTVPKQLERVAEWLAANRPDILTTLVLAKDLPVGTVEMLLVDPGQRLGILHIADEPPSQTKFQGRWGINWNWVPSTGVL